MEITIPHPVLQLCILVVITYGVFLMIYQNDYRTYKEKKKEQMIGIILVSLGSAVIFFIWFVYFITYERKELL